MQYLIIDIETEKICASITDLVSRYDNPKDKACEIVKSMNDNLISSGDVACFKVIEAKDNLSIINTEHDELAEIADRYSNLSQEEKYLFSLATGKKLESTDKKVINLCNYIK